MAHPFWERGSLGDRTAPLVDQGVPGVALVGNPHHVSPLGFPWLPPPIKTYPGG